MRVLASLGGQTDMHDATSRLAAPLQRPHVLVALASVQPQRLQVQSADKLAAIQLGHILRLCSRHGTARWRLGNAAMPPQPVAAVRPGHPSWLSFWTCRQSQQDGRALRRSLTRMQPDCQLSAEVPAMLLQHYIGSASIWAECRAAWTATCTSLFALSCLQQVEEACTLNVPAITLASHRAKVPSWHDTVIMHHLHLASD